jgi:hypothetical protein
MSTEFAATGLTLGQLNAVVKMLGGHNGALRLLRGELVISEPARPWREENSIIRFTVTSDGTSGKDWIPRLEDRGYVLHRDAKTLLKSESFKPTSGVITEVAVLRADRFDASMQLPQVICSAAFKRGYSRTSLEAACLIREKFTDSEIVNMGLRRIIIGHDPADVQGFSMLMAVSATCSMDAVYYQIPENLTGMDAQAGMAFAVAHISAD